MRALVLADRNPTIDLLACVREERCGVVILLGDLDGWALAPLAQSPVPVMGVYGNHCRGDYLSDIGAVNLHMRRVQFGPLVVGGFEGGHRYKAGEYPAFDQWEASFLLDRLPRVDVLVCHSPPAGVNDHDDVPHQGFVGLRDYVLRERPLMLLHGHTYPTEETLVTRFADTDVRYVHGHDVVELPAHGRG